MKIEAVITCVNYSDYLAATLPHNRKLLDYTVVVTTREDTQTQRVCEYWNVHCVVTDVFGSPPEFRKGAGINAGLDVLLSRPGPHEWLWHLDADIFLPPLTRDWLQRLDLDPLNLYGADRLMVPNFAAWSSFLRLPALQHESNVFVHPVAFPLGVRVAHPDYGGYLPIGYSQLWSTATGVTRYPAEHTDAGRSDMLFARQWPRARRELIPEFFVYHLESAPADMGANWNGRTTPQFGPEPHPAVLADLESRAAKLTLSSAY